MEITYEFVKKMFDYDPEGFLVWTKEQKNQFAGCRAGGLSKGYWVIQFVRGGERHGAFAHRLIFLWHHGYLPPSIDHANRIKTDNRIENLRPADQTQQIANRGISPRSATGYKGVEYDKRKNKFRARIRAYGKRKNLGWFKTPEEAHAAYVKAAKEAFGDFACAG